LKDRVSATI
jgi:chromosome segregation ATPase